VKRGGVLEECINQVVEMSDFHPQSVNTVRLSVIRLPNRVVIFEPFMRIGRGGSCVDNAGAGGLIAAIDSDTGKVIACGDEMGRTYEYHPDTGKKIIGFTVPMWKEACQLGRELAEIVPTTRYIGWDIALTKKGWDVVEGNEMAQFVAQLATKKGIRTRLDAIVKEVLKYDKDS